jgi:hypothetical protein
MGKRPHIYSRIGLPLVLIMDLSHCVAHQIVHVMFAFSGYFVVLVAVFNLSSLLVLCSALPMFTTQVAAVSDFT